MKKVLLILSLFFLVINCNGQTNKKNNNKMEQTDIKTKRLPKTITIESPISAELKVYVEGTDLIGEVKLINTTDKPVILPNNRIGGRSIHPLKGRKDLADVFYAIPIPYKKNLTFIPIMSLSDTIFGNGYTVLKPQETKVTYTKLNKIFDLYEQKYEKVRFLFSPCIPLLNEKHEQIVDKKDSMKRPIDFYIHCNKVEISYDEIKDKIK